MTSLPILQVPTPVIKGDTWPGLTLTLTDDGSLVNLNGATITCDLYLGNTKTISFSNVTENINDPKITILEGVNGKFQFDSIDELDLEQGTHTGYLKIAYPDGTVITYCQIQLIVIVAR